MRQYTLALTSIALAAISLTGCSTPSFVVHISTGAPGEKNISMQTHKASKPEATAGKETQTDQNQADINSASRKDNAEAKSAQPEKANKSIIDNKKLPGTKHVDTKAVSALKAGPKTDDKKQPIVPSQIKNNDSRAKDTARKDSKGKADSKESLKKSKQLAEQNKSAKAKPALNDEAKNIKIKKIANAAKIKNKEAKNTKIKKIANAAKIKNKKAMNAKVGKLANLPKIKKKRAAQPKKKEYKKPHFNAIAGSLRENIQRFANQYHYQLIWNMYDPATGFLIDYSWVGNKKMENKNPLIMLHKMIDPYNVDTKVWKENRVICITNNNSCNK